MSVRNSTPLEKLAKRINAASARATDAGRRLREARDALATHRRTLEALRAERIAAEQAELRAALRGLQERLRVHGEVLGDLEERCLRLELVRLQKQKPRV